MSQYFDLACTESTVPSWSKVASILTREIAKRPQTTCEMLGKVADITSVYQPKRISAILE